MASRFQVIATFPGDGERVASYLIEFDGVTILVGLPLRASNNADATVLAVDWMKVVNIESIDVVIAHDAYSAAGCVDIVAHPRFAGVCFVTKAAARLARTHRNACWGRYRGVSHIDMGQGIVASNWWSPCIAMQATDESGWCHAVHLNEAVADEAWQRIHEVSYAEPIPLSGVGATYVSIEALAGWS